MQPFANLSRNDINDNMKLLNEFLAKSLLLSLSFVVDCEFHDDNGWTVFQPSFSKPTQYTATPNLDDGCEEPGCYEDLISYREGSNPHRHL